MTPPPRTSTFTIVQAPVCGNLSPSPRKSPLLQDGARIKPCGSTCHRMSRNALTTPATSSETGCRIDVRPAARSAFAGFCRMRMRGRNGALCRLARLDEPQGRLLRQCADGKLLPHAQDRARPSPPICNTRGGQTRYLCLHRRLLQSNLSPLGHRLHQPDRDGAKSSLTLSTFLGEDHFVELMDPLASVQMSHPSFENSSAICPSQIRAPRDLRPHYSSHRSPLH